MWREKAGRESLDVAGALGLSEGDVTATSGGFGNTRQQVGLQFVFMNKFHFAKATKKKKRKKKASNTPGCTG